jgi:hypothetical protein
MGGWFLLSFSFICPQPDTVQFLPCTCTEFLREN